MKNITQRLTLHFLIPLFIISTQQYNIDKLHNNGKSGYFPANKDQMHYSNEIESALQEKIFGYPKYARIC